MTPLYTLSQLRDRSKLLRQAHQDTQVGLDLAGAALVGGLALVAVGLAGRTGTDATPLVQLLAACVAVVAGVAVVGGGVHGALVPAGVALWVGWVAWRWQGELLAGPLEGPFGYRNAGGAFLAQGAIAALMVGAALRRWWWVALALVPAIGLGAVAVGASFGAAAPLALAPLALLALAGPRWARVAVIVCGAAFVVVLSATAWLGARHDPRLPATGIGATVADAGLTERRLDLWHDALVILGEQPSGVGLSRFAEISPTALGDIDAALAHQEFLQVGAEMGWAGLMLVLTIVAWAFVRLWAMPEPDAVTVLAAAAVGGLAIHACIDHVLHAPQVLLAACALLGTGMVSRRRAWVS